MEDRFETEEANMADFMAQHLPREDAMQHFSPFYNDVWKFYIENLEMMNLLAKASEHRESFERFLQFCKRENYPELFAAALALKIKKLQMK